MPDCRSKDSDLSEVISFVRRNIGCRVSLLRGAVKLRLTGGSMAVEKPVEAAPVWLDCHRAGSP